MPRSVVEGHRDVVAAARAHHEHPVERPRGQMGVHVVVERLLGPQQSEWIHRLMAEPVHAQGDPPVARLDRRDLVVGRPRVVCRERVRGEDQRHSGERGDLRGSDRPIEHEEESDTGEQDPYDRAHPEERQQAEPDDPGDAAEHVEPIGLQGIERPERPGDPLGDQRHDEGGSPEHQRQRHPHREGRQSREPAEHGDITDARLLDREQDDEEREERECDRREREEVSLRTRPEESDAHAEEAREQDEVGQIAEVDVVLGRPTDEDQFHEEHECAQHHEPDPALQRKLRHPGSARWPRSLPDRHPRRVLRSRPSLGHSDRRRGQRWRGS